MKCKDCKNYIKGLHGDYFGACKDYQERGINLYCSDNDDCYLDKVINADKEPIETETSFCPVCNEPLYMFYYCVFCGQKVIRSKKDIKNYEKHNSN